MSAEAMLRSPPTYRVVWLQMTAEAAALALESDRFRKEDRCLSPVETPKQGSPEVSDTLNTPAVCTEAVPGAQVWTTAPSIFITRYILFQCRREVHNC